MHFTIISVGEKTYKKYKYAKEGIKTPDCACE